MVLHEKDLWRKRRTKQLSFQCQFFLLILYVLFCARRCGSSGFTNSHGIVMVLVYPNMYLTLIFFLLFKRGEEQFFFLFFRRLRYYGVVYYYSIYVLMMCMLPIAKAKATLPCKSGKRETIWKHCLRQNYISRRAIASRSLRMKAGGESGM